MLATIVQLMGEDKGFDYLKALHKNINQYTKSGAAPAKAASLGETADRHHLPARHRRDGGRQGAPIKIVAPCEGTGYEIGSMSIIKGAQEPRQRQEVVRLGADARGPGARRGGQVLSGAVEQERARAAAGAEARASIKLIDYDFAKYGSSAERKRLLSKWDNEVKNLPK